MTTWAEFVTEVSQKRGCGETLGALRLWETWPNSAALEQWLKESGFALPWERIPDIAISGLEAAEIIAHGLKYGMAYGEPLPTYWEADDYGLKFVELQSAGARFFKTHSYVTNATFEIGVMAVADKQSSALWFMDED